MLDQHCWYIWQKADSDAHLASWELGLTFTSPVNSDSVCKVWWKSDNWKETAKNTAIRIWGACNFPFDALIILYKHHIRNTLILKYEMNNYLAFIACFDHGRLSGLKDPQTDVLAIFLNPRREVLQKGMNSNECGGWCGRNQFLLH